LGISFPEACKQCAGEWEATPKDEKETYKEIAKGRTSPASLGIELGFRTPHQNKKTELVQQLDAEELDADEMEAQMIGWIERKVAPRSGEPVNMDSCYVVGHINVYFHPRDKNHPLMPAEVAFARFSLSGGLKETFHAMLNLPLPQIYTFSAIALAKKTHHIPPRKLGETDIGRVERELAEFLKNEPVFVMDTYNDQNQNENMTRFLRESVNMAGPQVYDLPTLMSTMENTVFYNRPETGVKDNPIGPVLYNPSIAEKYFEDDPFLYKIKSNESCEYHWAIDNGQFCSLNVVKRRVYSIWAKVGRRAAMPASGGSSLAGLEKEGATVPLAQEILADETDEAVIAYRAIECRKEETNAFGEQVTKAGSMNGQVFANPDKDPEREMKQAIQEQQMSFSNLTIDGGEKYRGGSVVTYDDDDTTSVTTTETGSVLGPTSDFPSLSSAMSSEVGGARRRPPPLGFGVVASALGRKATAGGGTGSIQSGATTVTDNSMSSAKKKSRLVAKFGN